MHPNCPTYKQKLEDLKSLHNEFQEELEVFKISRDSKKLNKIREGINGIEEYFKGEFNPEIEVLHAHPDGRKETINFNFESKLQEFISFYQTTKIDLPKDFKETIKDIWKRNQKEMEEAIKEKGFDDMLIVPPTTNIKELSEKMKMGKGYQDWIVAKANVQDLGNIPLNSSNIDKPRIILVHKTQNLKDRPELKRTIGNTKGQDVKINEALSLEDYLIFQKKYYEENNDHLDCGNYTWLSTKSDLRLIISLWSTSDSKLDILVGETKNSGPLLGVRFSRYFF